MIFSPGVGQGSIDRLSSAVDKDRLHPDRFHENDIQQDVHQSGFIIDDAAAQLDDRRFSPKSANPAHRLDQRVGFGDCFVHAEVSKSLQAFLGGSQWHGPREGLVGVEGDGKNRSI